MPTTETDQSSAETQLATTAHAQTAAYVLAELVVDPARGLTTAEAEARHERLGRNEVPAEPPVPAWQRLLGQFQDPLTLLLLVATVVSFVVWLVERETPAPYDAIVILLIVIVNGALGFAQESRAGEALDGECPLHGQVRENDGTTRIGLAAERVQAIVDHLPEPA